MRNRRTTLVTTAAVGVAAAVAVGAVTLGAGSSAGSSAGYSRPSTPSAASGHGTPSRVTLHTATASVDGTTRRILVDAAGQPLYTYRPDTATTSHVAGELAVLWPPLVARTATARGATGDVSTVSTANGSQVAYNGHLLYTFVQDEPGQVTGQGVQDFFVATPDLSPLTSPGSGSAPVGGGY